MSIAVAEQVLSGEAWTPLSIARRFLEAFFRDPRAGYSEGFHAFLSGLRLEAEHRFAGVQSTTAGRGLAECLLAPPSERHPHVGLLLQEMATVFLDRIKSQSDKSGAAMRSAPIGFYDSLDEVVKRSALQAGVTHDTPAGIAAAVAASLMTHYFVYDLGPKAELGGFLATHVRVCDFRSSRHDGLPTGRYTEAEQQDWATPYSGKVKSKGWMSVRAAVTAVVRHDNLRDILKACVDFTGDVDTVATIALAAASCSHEVEQNLPECLRCSLEDGKYGVGYLRDLDRGLGEHVGSSRNQEA